MINPPICAACGGKCCKTIPGIYWPSDIVPLTADRIAAMIRADLACIDWWEGPIEPEAPSRCLFLRGRAVNDHGAITGSWGGQCTQLTEQGCRLEWEARPRVCRELMPGATLGDDCVVPEGLDKRSCAATWLPYQALLKAVVVAERQNSPPDARLALFVAL